MENAAEPTEDLQTRLQRLDNLIASREDGFRGLGIRLALGLAAERREGLAPGTETGPMVQAWIARFGMETVEDAIVQARVLVTQPEKMAQEFSRRLQEGKEAPPANEDDETDDA
jgi:hypothetical protein